LLQINKNNFLKEETIMFRLGDFAFDRIQMGIAENFNDELLYALMQLADATIDITAGETKEIRDKDGNLIRKIYLAKEGTFSANNAMMNTNILSAAGGSAIERATQDKIMAMPSIEIVKAGSTITLTDVVEGSVKVMGAYKNGASGDAYTLGTAASATEFAYDADTGVVTPPTVTGDDAPAEYLVVYEKNQKDGFKIANIADKFPATIKLTLKALYVDPCLKDHVRPAYIVLPSFQPSPEVSVATATDTQLEYKGDLQIDYCGEDKALYYIYFPNETTTV
jgi:hypothetical protein